MTETGTVIDGKYEILKLIGKGGMSFVYLAQDTHLNRNWAVKEVRKKGDGKKDDIVINSLLAEANMIKGLDHPALPRIVDIIDNGQSIYIVMDYIEGVSLDKILKEEGAQSEEKVIGWAMQACDVLSYLHSQKKPIIYRDMKPANLMLKPNGNISIIDFGIAREYKENNAYDTTVLGTKGYAPPEQYSGQTDARSDIFALGMTMHHLLTNVEPKAGMAYAPVRHWNPALSEGIEAIIDKCVQPAPENRYQSCEELLIDLQDPGKVTRQWKKQLRRKLHIFIAAAVASAVMLVTGGALSAASVSINNGDYELLLEKSDTAAYYEAIAIYPGRADAYEKLIENCIMLEDESGKNDTIVKIGNTIDNNANALDINDSNAAQLYYDIGKLYFSDYNSDTATLKSRAANSKKYFEKAVSGDCDYDKKQIAQCYYDICCYMSNSTTTKEPSRDDYYKLIDEIKDTIEYVRSEKDSDANYDAVSFYYAYMLFIAGQHDRAISFGISLSEIESEMKAIVESAGEISSELDAVKNCQQKINESYDAFMAIIRNAYINAGLVVVG